MESSQILNFGWANDHYMRREMAKDFRWFCAIYLSHYFKLKPATFHPELCGILSNHDERMLEIIGFRGSAKSTFGSLALILWAALEHPKEYPFIIPIADTSTQSKLNMSNIKQELDNNWLLRHDYGSVKSSKFSEPNPEPDLESEEEWQAQNVLLENGVRIMCRSRGQKVRGMRHGASRPALIVVDDPEDREWVKTKENRDKTDQWMRGEVIPARDVQKGRIVVIGNWLHEDALMARLKKTDLFNVKEFALVENNMVTWPALYPTDEAIVRERQLVGETAWQREYLLHIVPEEGAIVVPSDITYYDETSGDLEMTGHGVDLAISKEAAADFTTDVTGEARYDHKEKRVIIYVLPRPLNRKMNFLETIEHCVSESKKAFEQIFFIEDVQYQKAAIEELIRRGVNVTPMRPTKDKRSRFIVAAPHIKNGRVRFPRHGCEDLLAQMFGFGVESHDDLVDGLVYLIAGLAQTGLDFVPITGVDIGFGPEKPPRLPKDPLNEDE